MSSPEQEQKLSPDKHKVKVKEQKATSKKHKQKEEQDISDEHKDTKQKGIPKPRKNEKETSTPRKQDEKEKKEPKENKQSKEMQPPVSFSSLKTILVIVCLVIACLCVLLVACVYQMAYVNHELQEQIETMKRTIAKNEDELSSLTKNTERKLQELGGSILQLNATVKQIKHEKQTKKVK